jgi:hypothetical protein
MELNLTPDYKTEILTAVDVAEASLARGEGRTYYAGIHAAPGR